MKIVDARGLQHPEPFERVVEALTELALGDQLKLIIHQEPRPLYRFLERNRSAYKNDDVADNLKRGDCCRSQSDRAAQLLRGFGASPHININCGNRIPKSSDGTSAKARLRRPRQSGQTFV